MKRKKFVVPVILTASLLAVFFYLGWMSKLTLSNPLVSSLEFSHLFQAKLFSAGRSYEILDQRYSPLIEPFLALIDGKLFSQLPPGFPLILSVGLRLGIPSLLNPLFSILTLLLVYGIAARRVGRRNALIATLILATNPYFLRFGTSLLPQPTSLFLTTLTIALLQRTQNSPRPILLFGLIAINLLEIATDPLTGIISFILLQGALALSLIKKNRGRLFLMEFCSALIGLGGLIGLLSHFFGSPHQIASAFYNSTSLGYFERIKSFTNLPYATIHGTPEWVPALSIFILIVSLGVKFLEAKITRFFVVTFYLVVGGWQVHRVFENTLLARSRFELAQKYRNKTMARTSENSIVFLQLHRLFQAPAPYLERLDFIRNATFPEPRIYVKSDDSLATSKKLFPDRKIEFVDPLFPNNTETRLGKKGNPCDAIFPTSAYYYVFDSTSGPESFLVMNVEIRNVDPEKPIKIRPKGGDYDFVMVHPDWWRAKTSVSYDTQRGGYDQATITYRRPSSEKMGTFDINVKMNSRNYSCSDIQIGPDHPTLSEL